MAVNAHAGQTTVGHRAALRRACLGIAAAQGRVVVMATILTLCQHRTLHNLIDVEFHFLPLITPEWLVNPNAPEMGANSLPAGKQSMEASSPSQLDVITQPSKNIGQFTQT